MAAGTGVGQQFAGLVVTFGKNAEGTYAQGQCKQGFQYTHKIGHNGRLLVAGDYNLSLVSRQCQVELNSEQL